MSNVITVHHATLKLKDGNPTPVRLPVERIAFFVASQTDAFTNIQLNTISDRVMPVIETEQELIQLISCEQPTKNKPRSKK
jgi:hypothetical protein